jgi:hypothetical protein
MYFERCAAPHAVGRLRGHRDVADGGLANAIVRMAPRARQIYILLWRRRGRAFRMGPREGFCAQAAIATVTT